MSASDTSAAATTARDLIPPALARAWQAASLYDSTHPVTLERAGELSKATGLLTDRLRLVVDPKGVSIDGKALEPAAMYAGLADALHRGGVYALEFNAPMDVPRVRALFGAMVRRREEGEGGLDAAIGVATDGAVVAHRLTATTLALTSTEGEGGQADEGVLSFRAMVEAGIAGAGAGRTGAERPVLRMAREALEQVEQAGNEQEAQQRLERLKGALSELSTDQRRYLVGLLSTSEGLEFDRAVQLLSIMPADELASGISVLERPDTRLSQTALMLMRRLAHLALGRDQDLTRLGSVARAWGSASRGGDERERAIADTAANLLGRLGETEFRTAEYTQLLEELAGLGKDAETADVNLAPALDELPTRVVETVIASLGATPPEGCDRVGALTFLLLRLPMLAESGRLDLVALARTFAARLADDGTPAEKKAANDLLTIGDQGGWVASGLVTCDNPDLVREAAASLPAKVAAEALVRALRQPDVQRRWDAVAAGVAEVDTAAMVQALHAALPEDPTLPLRVRGLLSLLPVGESIDLLQPCARHEDVAVRREAYAVILATNLPWPAELCTQGLRDLDENIRTMTIRAVARHPGRHTTLLIDRLGGTVGLAPLAPQEPEELARAIRADESSQASKRLAVVLWRRAVIPSPHADCETLLRLVCERPRTPRSIAARVTWRLLGVSRGGQRAA